VGIVWSNSWQKSSEESLRIGSMHTTVQNIRGELYRQLKEVFDATFLQDSDAAEEYGAYTDNINHYLSDLAELAKDQQEKEAISEVLKAYVSFHDDTQKLFEVKYLDSQQQQLLDIQLEQSTLKQIEDAFSYFDQLLQNKQNALTDTRHRWLSRLAWMAPIPVLLAIFLLMMARRFVRRNVVVPLAEVIEGAKRISTGDLHHTIPQMGVADLIRLAQAINSMANELSTSRDELIETKKQAALGELVPLVAHNIRNPLAGIRAASQVTRDEDVSEATRDALTDIIVAVDRLEHWVTSLLRYLHPVDPHFSSTTLTMVADNALSLIELDLSDKQIELVREGWEQQAQSIALDIHLFEQAIFNLVQNALEASSPRGKVKLCYQQSRDTVSLKIIDQGSGMQFDPITEEVKKGEHKRLGCGLGIPFSLKVIKQHGGSLSYDAAPTGGTIVTITLAINAEMTT